MNAVISPECIAALDPAAGRMEDHWLPTSDAGKNLLYGRHLAIGAIDLPPFVYLNNITKDFKVNDVDGFNYQIILYLAAKYQFSFQYFAPPDASYGGLVNGSWNGLMGMIIRKELDLNAACMIVNYPRSLSVDFTFQYYNDPISLLMPYPTLDSSINGIVRPFQYYVWILIISSILVMTLALWKIFSMELWIFDKKRNVSRLSLYDSFWSLLDFGFVDMEVINSSRLPIRILATTLCLITFVLSTAYSSTLTSFLLTPHYNPMIDSVGDIAKLSRPVFMVTKYSSYETIIFNTKEGPLVKIGESILKYDSELRRTNTAAKGAREVLIDLIVKRQRTFTSLRSFLLSVMEGDFKKTGQCRLYLAKEPWDIARASFILQKSSPLTPVINKQIIWLRDVGLLDYWSRRYWPLTNKCSEPLPTSLGDQVPLNFDALSSHFILLGCGLVGSSIVFMIEWIQWICTKPRI